MQKYLITGFSGFVSKHFIEFLEENKINSSILGIDIHEPDFNLHDLKYVKIAFEKIDLLQKNSVENIIYQFQPDFILHLASFSSVSFSWKEPIQSFQNNTNIFLNLLESIRKLKLKTRILSIGSSEEYGDVNENEIPLKESSLLKPISPYAVARVSQELLSKVYVEGYGMDIVMTRSFNHIGPGQKDIFVVSSFAKQLVKQKKNNILSGELITGDVSIIRDFLDVRDVVSAYYLLFLNGKKGEIYNICSGVGISLKEIINQLAEILGAKVKIKVDKNLIRPNDNKVIIGSNEKIKNEIGWNNKIKLKQSLCSIIDFWEKQ